MSSPTTSVKVADRFADLSGPELSRVQADLQKIDALVNEAGLVSVLNVLEHPELRAGHPDLSKRLDLRALADLADRLDEAGPAAEEMVRPGVLEALRGSRDVTRALDDIRSGNGSLSLRELSDLCSDRLSKLSAELPGVVEPGGSLPQVAGLARHVALIGGSGLLPVSSLEPFVLRDRADLEHVQRLVELARAKISVPTHWVDPRRSHNGEAVEIGERMLRDGTHRPQAISDAVSTHRSAEILIDNLLARDVHFTRDDYRRQVQLVLANTDDRPKEGLSGVKFVRMLNYLCQEPSGKHPHQIDPIDGIERLWAGAMQAFVNDRTGRPYTNEEMVSSRSSINTKIYGCMIEAAAAIKLMDNGFKIVALSAREWDGARLVSNNVMGMRSRGTQREFDIVAVAPNAPDEMLAIEVKASYRALLEKNGKLMSQYGQQRYEFAPGIGDKMQIKAHISVARGHDLVPAMYVHRIDDGEVEMVRRPGMQPQYDIASWQKKNMQALLRECVRSTRDCPLIFGADPSSPNLVKEHLF